MGDGHSPDVAEIRQAHHRAAGDTESHYLQIDMDMDMDTAEIRSSVCTRLRGIWVTCLVTSGLGGAPFAAMRLARRRNGGERKRLSKSWHRVSKPSSYPL